MDALICESVSVCVVLTVVLRDALTVTGVVLVVVVVGGGGCPALDGAPGAAVINYNE